MGLRVLVTGDRNWPISNYSFIWNVLDDWHREYVITHLVQGMARGVDDIAQRWALSRGVDTDDDHYPADWDNPAYRTKTGKSFAGNIRNQQMLDEGKPDVVIAFHKDLENSRGTKDMVGKARAAGIQVVLYPEPVIFYPESE